MFLARKLEPQKAMVGETEVKERPKSNPDYLMQLMNDRKVMSSLPNFSGIFTHLERLLDEGKPAPHHSESVHFLPIILLMGQCS